MMMGPPSDWAPTMQVVAEEPAVVMETPPAASKSAESMPPSWDELFASLEKKLPSKQ